MHLLRVFKVCKISAYLCSGRPTPSFSGCTIGVLTVLFNAV